jgi:adenylate cyclase
MFPFDYVGELVGHANLLLQPTPPPKQYPIGPLQNPSSVSRGFGFPSKNSLVSLVSLRQNSSSSVYRSNGGSSIRSSETQITLTVPERKRRSADDSESSRGLFYSGSSTNSGEMHKSKSSYNLFSKLKSRPSKTHLRSESEDSEHPSHPSLRPPIPPIPQQRYPNPLFSSISSNSSTPTIVSIPSSVTSKGKRDKGKKRLGSKMPPPPPAKDASIASQDSLDLASKMGVVDFSPDQLEGIVDFSIAAGGLYSSSSASHGFAGMRDPNSPSSGFDSAQSHSDHSTYPHQYFLPQTEFSDPFSSTSPQDKRKGMISSPEPWKPLPKYPNPPPPHGFLHAQATSPTDGPGSPSWAAPDSWAVDKGTGDYYTIPELSEGYNSDSDDGNATMGPLSNGAGKSRTEDRPRRRARNVGSVSLSSMASSSALGTGTLSRLRSQPPPGATYRMRMYTPNSAYHVIAIDLDITVAGLTAKLSKKMPQTKNGRVYLYLKEQGRGVTRYSIFPAMDLLKILPIERILGPHERPAAIVKLRMEQAGYDYEDGQHLLGIENLNILLKFVYKAQLLAGVRYCLSFFVD